MSSFSLSFIPKRNVLIVFLGISRLSSSVAAEATAVAATTAASFKTITNARSSTVAFGSPNMDRRTALLSSLTTASSIFCPSPSYALTEEDVDKKEERIGMDASSFRTYGVIPDATNELNPTLDTIINEDFINKFSCQNMKGGALWLGEHHNSETDHMLQANIIQSLYDLRCKSALSPSSTSQQPLAIGLEQIQIKYQSTLDQFVQGTISEEQMLEEVDWERRWVWPYEKYRPVFQLARKLQIPLIALNVNSEDMAIVSRAGLPGLSESQLGTYIKDRVGFAKFSQSTSFKTYVNYVVLPSYDLHQRMGLLRQTMNGEVIDTDMSVKNFYSGRILWDESMAMKAHSWTAANPGGLMIGLVGADHVKFSKGIPGRYARMAGETRDTVSVILNPTLIDTRPTGTVFNVKEADSAQYPDKITLQLRYLKDGIDINSSDVTSPESTGGVLPLADYILVSKSREYDNRT